jgi:branched-chain amino acid transport system ATP-binding protein
VRAIPNLRVEGLEVAYGDLQVLWGLDFAVEDRKIVSLIGSNGAGKTTTLKAIAGLLSPIRGSVSLDGRDVTGMPVEQRVEAGIVYVPEGRGLFPDLSVLENLVMGSFNRRARQKKSESLRGVFALFPILKERQHQAAGTLSGGESQMLAIGRGLMALPRLLMLDEPSAGISPRVSDGIFQAIAKLRDEEGITILLVEQDASRALAMSDGGHILENGRIELSGAGPDLLGNPYVRTAYLGV